VPPENTDLAPRRAKLGRLSGIGVIGERKAAVPVHQ
jgi:hypothetical protein